MRYVPLLVISDHRGRLSDRLVTRLEALFPLRQQRQPASVRQPNHTSSRASIVSKSDRVVNKCLCLDAPELERVVGRELDALELLCALEAGQLHVHDTLAHLVIDLQRHSGHDHLLVALVRPLLLPLHLHRRRCRLLVFLSGRYLLLRRVRSGRDTAKRLKQLCRRTLHTLAHIRVRCM